MSQERRVKRIVKDLEKQGCRIKPTKAGWLVFFPNGESTAFHKSPSDVRTDKNQRQYVLRAGLSWPG